LNPTASSATFIRETSLLQRFVAAG
jgi:hypothetical protein